MQTRARNGAMAAGGGTSTAVTMRPAQASAMAAAERQTSRARPGDRTMVELMWNGYPLLLSAQTRNSWRGASDRSGKDVQGAAAHVLAEDLGLLGRELLVRQDA